MLKPFDFPQVEGLHNPITRNAEKSAPQMGAPPVAQIGGVRMASGKMLSRGEKKVRGDRKVGMGSIRAHGIVSASTHPRVVVGNGSGSVGSTHVSSTIVPVLGSSQYPGEMVALKCRIRTLIGQLGMRPHREHQRSMRLRAESCASGKICATCS